MPKNILGPIIKRLRLKQNLTQKELSQLTGFNQNTISNHENQKRSLREEEILIYAKALNVTPQELFDNYRQDKKTPELMRKYNYFPEGISAGLPQEVDPFTDQQMQTLSLPSQLLGKYSDVRDIIFLPVNGESMNRVLPDGSLIGLQKINQLSELHNNDLVVFQVNQAVAVKRFYYDAQRRFVQFIPDSNNPDFPTLTYQIDDFNETCIIGKVIICITNF